MRRWLLLSVIAAALASGVLAAPDLKRAQAESNLEKRSGLALDNAAAALRSARESYQKGDNRQVEADVTEIKDSVDLAYTSLVQTGKDPRRSPKWFKHAVSLRDQGHCCGFASRYNQPVNILQILDPAHFCDI